jgi:hypothetical protein
MKRRLPFTVAILLTSVSLCFAQAQQENTKPASTRSNESSSANKALEEKVVALERQTWEAIKKKDWEALSSLLAEDLRVVSDTGVAEKSEVIEELKTNYTLMDYTLQEVRVVELSSEAALITYKAVQNVSHKGQGWKSQAAYHSSIWVKRDGKWQSVLHQITPVKQEASAEKRGEPTTPKPQATASSSTNKALEDKIIANEKQAWEAIKKRATRAHGKQLADDYLGVGDTGVNTKSEWLSALKEAKWSLDDYSMDNVKVSELSKDVALITYKVEQKGMYGGENFSEPAYASTVLVRRGGNWLAVLHQQTPVKQATAAR